MDSGAAPLDLAGLLALAAVLGWASGIRLYAMLFVVGLAGRLAWVTLPAGLEPLTHGGILLVTGGLLGIEFLADKVPLIDSLWDTVHTFIRIPAGAAVAAMVFGGQGEAWQLAMALLGGTLAASAHAVKAGARAAINLSPEPLSNIGASLSEDSLTIGAIWLVFVHPWIALGALTGFVVLAAWLLPRLWRAFAGPFRRRSGSSPA